MKITQFNLEPLKDGVYTSSIVAVVLIYMAAFFLPLTLGILANKALIKNKIFLILLLIFGIVTLWFIKNHFNPLHIVFTYFNREGNLVFSNSSGNFPYFKNIFGREGFFVDDFQGTKYYFRGFFDLFKYWNLVAITTLPIILAVIAFKKKNFSNIYLVFMIIYGGALLLYPKIYDRYLLYLFPALLLFLVSYVTSSKKVLYAIFVPFTAFLIFLNYQYAQDFVRMQNYVWKTSQMLLDDGLAEPNDIKSGNSWQALYPRENNNWTYYFAYDTKGRCCFEIIEEHEIKFSWSLFLNPKINLYKRIE